MRRPSWIPLLLTLALTLASTATLHAAEPCGEWADWQAFKTQKMSEGGRVVDGSSPRKVSTSEGQSYALFFALVGNDRPAFERILNWTRDNLAGGDLTARLSAWHWGRRDNGTWGVLDPNAASDADLWIAYTLMEAGRLWQAPHYAATGRLLLKRVLREETADLPGLGWTLLPAPVGFALGEGRYRLNPSYLPPQLATRLAQDEVAFRPLLASNLTLLTRSAPRGYAPDWTAWQPTTQTLVADPKTTEPTGSYDAIRVYLWVGMLAKNAPERSRLLGHFAPMATTTSKLGYVPERVNPQTGATQGTGPIGFSMALLPLLTARGDTEAAEVQQLRYAAQSDKPLGYYDHVLTLFGLGWQQGWYAFGADGQLHPRWEKTCKSH